MRHAIVTFGAVLTATLLGLPASAQQAEPAELPSAAEVIDRYVAAIGGRQAVLEQAGLHAQGSVELPGMGMGGEIQTWTTEGGYREWTNLPQVGTAEVGFDGDVGWSLNSITGASVLTGRMLDQVRESARLTGALHEGAEIEALAVIGASEFANRPVWELAVTTTGGETYSEYFDRETGLLLGFERVLASPMGDVPTTVVLEDYRPVAGVLVPWLRRDRMMGVEQVTTLTTVTAGAIPEERFAPPRHVRVLMSDSEAESSDGANRRPEGGVR